MRKFAEMMSVILGKQSGSVRLITVHFTDSKKSRQSENNENCKCNRKIAYKLYDKFNYSHTKNVRKNVKYANLYQNVIKILTVS